MSTQRSYQYLVPRPESHYRQLFFKGTRLRAEYVYAATISEEDRWTPEQAAEEYGLPLEAVREAIAYCESNPPEIASDHAREERLMEAFGMNHPDYKWNPKAHFRLPPMEELARLLDDEPVS